MGKFDETQEKVYKFIQDFINKNSIPPTVREICYGVGLKSTSSAHIHLHRLADQGLINIDKGKQRSITLVNYEKMQTEDSCHLLPLVGRVAAGEPIFAFDNIQEYIPISKSMLHGAGENEVFMLTIKGESMKDIGMNEDDMIIVHNGLNCNNGDIVVARIGGDEATVKRFFRQDNEIIRLQPENSTMSPIYAKTVDVEIVGKVIGLMRKY